MVDSVYIVSFRCGWMMKGKMPVMRMLLHDPMVLMTVKLLEVGLLNAL